MTVLGTKLIEHLNLHNIYNYRISADGKTAAFNVTEEDLSKGVILGVADEVTSIAVGVQDSLGLPPNAFLISQYIIFNLMTHQVFENEGGFTYKNVSVDLSRVDAFLDTYGKTKYASITVQLGHRVTADVNPITVGGNPTIAASNAVFAGGNSAVAGNYPAVTGNYPAV
jgi:hypothetical protein